jgi:FkbM family methyltransferase
MMNAFLQTLAARTSSWFGRDHWLVRTARPLYASCLDWLSGGRGYQRTINDHERLYINPRCRGLFPECYEPEVFAFLRSRVRPGAVCLNIGAHVGIYALCLAQWVGPTGKVFAFEPNPETAEVLRDHLARNHFQERVEVVPLAVSDAPGEAEFASAGLAGFNRLGLPNPERAETHALRRVRVTTIDAFCAERQLRPDWILLDVEGFEIGALRGADDTLRRCRPDLQLIVEMHPRLWELSGGSRAALESLLAAYGLQAVPLTGQCDVFDENGVASLPWQK